MKRELIAEPDLVSLAAWDGQATAPASTLPLVVSATELYQDESVRLRPVLKDLLWEGLTMLIARPKAGKSWLTLQMSIHISGGREVQGITALEHGTVLYCALEEPRARTMGRLRDLAPQGDWTCNLHFIYELLPLMGGGAEQLEALLTRFQPRVVVLDSFTALVKTGSKAGSDIFRTQYAEVSRIRRLSEKFGAAIIVVHHMRKGISDGAIEAVAGTGGIAAAVDTLWQLKRKPEGEATLDVVGRETEERTLAMRFDREPLGWRVLGDDDAQVLNSERRQVIELLREDGALTPARISAELGKSRPATRMLLKRMAEHDLVRKEGSKYITTHT